VRELRNAVERSVARGSPDAEIAEVVLDPFASPWPLAEAPTARRTPETLAETARKPPVERSPVGGILSDPLRSFDLPEAMKRVEHDLLQQALAAQRYNQKATARQLGLTYDQLRNRLRKHGLLGEGGKGA